MSRKYYFDNEYGYRNFLDIMQEAELQSGATPMGPNSLLFKYIKVIDPTAEITFTLTEDAVVVVELNNHVTPPVIDYLISNISITDNTIFVSMTETVFCAEEYSLKHNLKFITMPVTHDSKNVKNLALVKPFLISPGLFLSAPAAVVDPHSKDYLFLNLNRRATTSRLEMYAALTIKKLIAKDPYVVPDPRRGLVSMHWERTSEFDLHNELSSSLVDQDIINYAVELFKLPRIKTIPRGYTSTRLYHHCPKWYEDSWFSLVTESTAKTHYTSKPCITEKTIMPLVIGHPFLLYADHGSVELLRDLGFDTFDWLFDHSYDKEINGSKKIKSILRQVKDFNITNAIEQYDKINEAVSFNRKHLRSNKVKQAIADEWVTAIEELTL